MSGIHFMQTSIFTIVVYIYIYTLERLLLISASILHIQKSKLNTPAVYWL